MRNSTFFARNSTFFGQNSTFMGVFDRIFRRTKEKRSDNLLNSTLYGTLGSRYSEGLAMQLSTVYRCVDCIGDAVAQLPIQIMKVGRDGYKKPAVTHTAYWLINKEPSKYMSRHLMMKSMIVSMLLRGNAFVRIKRDYDGNAIELEFLHPSKVTIIDDERGHIIAYAHPDYGWIEPSDMIHVPNFSYDGEHGVSTLRHAINSLELAYDSEQHAKDFFESGASLSGVVTVNHVLTQKQKDDFMTQWRAKMSGASNSVALLEADMDYKAIGVNPADAQLLETRKYSVVDICRFFGVSPQKAYDQTGQSYASIEASQLAFLTDTLQPYLDKIELEFERKIFVPREKFKYEVSFDTSVLLRTDKTGLAEYYTKMYNLGALTTNDIRRQLDLEPVEKGDQAFIQSNLVPIDKPLNATQAQQQPDPNKNGSNNQQEDDETQK